MDLDSLERFGPAVTFISIIVAIVSMTLVLYIVIIANEFEPLDEPERTIVLSSPEVTHRVSGNVNYSDITITILKISPKDSIVTWNDLRITITTEEGIGIVEDSRVFPDNPMEYYGGMNTEDSIQLWYNESSEDSNRINPGDSMKITGLDDSLGFGSIDFKLGGEPAGSSKIPDLTS